MSSDTTGAAFQHGSISGYVRHSCRCDRCRTEWSSYSSDWRTWRKSHGDKRPPSGWRDQLRNSMTGVADG
jgi:hypothetical protein